MKLNTQNFSQLILVFVLLLTIFSCSKDSDLFLETVLAEEEIVIEEGLTTSNEPSNGNEESNAAADMEIRTTSFSTINDAHIESGKGFNQTIIRLEEGKRTSYLMFDLSPIQTIEGKIKKTSLQFTVESDDGYGPITIFKGQNSNWTEEEISQTSAPKTSSEIGSLTSEYKVGTIITLELEESAIDSEKTTFIIYQQNGNDFAFASKEHASKNGPKLVVEYETAKDAAAIARRAYY